VDGLGVPLSQFGVVRATAHAFVCNHMVWNFICGAAIITKNPYQLVLVCLRHWGCSNLFINMPPDACHVTDRFGTDWAEIPDNIKRNGRTSVQKPHHHNLGSLQPLHLCY
jgi:hypothetical protein